MSVLRQKMIDQMLLRGFSERTKESYLNAVSLLARYYHLPPDKLSHDQIQNWFLYLVKERKLSPSTCRLYLNGLRFFYLHVLYWQEFEFKIATPKREQKIPDLLSYSDIRSIIEHAKNPKYKTMFIVCYTCGLRVSELVALKVKNIQGEQRYLQVVQGKGFKDRSIPLSCSVLRILREYWKAFHPDQFLFPGQTLEKPISITSVQRYFKQTKARAGITKKGGIHGLRHAFATHQLSAGMPLHQLKIILGHTDLKSTERYLHWCPESNDIRGDFDLLLRILGGNKNG
jgi:site-specific recombinase XerD